MEIPRDCWPSASSAGLVPGMWPCGACNGSGKCTTCEGEGALGDEAWEDCLVQPYG